ncbi:transporter substrate-binding domain-containing protein [Deinococcus yavapaiensis]|uniref:ABC-type amino acid transport substrate-binding protein n=1 Tax=Deinococcus yavapaiensis KR-236 TaxID=694435 RepID=A0A318SGZ0_9DEIO|nr:transporter substrate-binding domain-containing protein [Deinococcus yavapaiensis]PYE53268.1 ABC-type amino acid transport substrate-binding protein [Deinococcus yavapaiensis KR-236]
MRRPILLLALIACSLALAQAPDDPNSTRGYLRTGKDLMFCLDKQNPMWRFEQDMATAIAQSLGRKADFFVHRQPLPSVDTAAQPLERTEMLRLFAHRCDVYPGLVGSTTPAFDYPADEQMFATRPYLKVSYVFVSRVKNIKSLTSLPKNVPLSMELRGLPAYFMYTLRNGRFTERPVKTAARLALDLKTGKAKAGLLFAPQLYSRSPNPGKEGMYVGPVKELPNMTWYVIAGVRRDRPTLRQQIDGAISRLIRRGEVAKLLTKHKLANPFIVPAAPNDTRPQSETFDEN